MAYLSYHYRVTTIDEVIAGLALAWTITLLPSILGAKISPQSASQFIPMNGFPFLWSWSLMVPSSAQQFSLTTSYTCWETRKNQDLHLHSSGGEEAEGRTAG